MSSLPAVAVVAVFVAAAAATWVAGVLLSKTTDELDRRLGIGDDLGGIVLLGIAGSLPEVAITISAAATGNIGLAAGNLIGGIATATMVLVICDLFAPRPLTYLVGSLVPVLEGVLVILVVVVALGGALLPRKDSIGGAVSPASIAIVVVWLAGVWILNFARKHPRWKVVAEGSQPGRRHHREKPATPTRATQRSLKTVATLFGGAALVTLGAGVLLEVSGSDLAARAHIDGVVFGATVLSLATALPEISSGIEAVRLGDHQLAVADVFGGNAFQLCLFLLADLVAHNPALPSAGPANAWLGGLAIAITVIYVTGIIIRPARPNRLGPDLILALGFYAIGIFGLLRIS